MEENNLSVKLIPFTSPYGFEIHKWNIDFDYAKVFRWSNRFLTMEECSNLQEVLGYEVLMIVGQAGHTLGMITAKEEPRGVVKFSILIDKKYQNKGIGSEAIDLFCNYCVIKKSARLVLTDSAGSDKWMHVALEAIGFSLAGSIPDHFLNEGKFEASFMFYKKVW